MTTRKPLVVSREAGEKLLTFEVLRRQLLHLLTADTDRDLTARQLAVMLHLRLHPMDPHQHTVKGLAASLGLNKPAITRAADRLAEYGLVVRKVDASDRRSVLIGLTKQGVALLDALARA